MRTKTKVADLIPPSAALWPGFLVALVGAAGAWLVADPTAPPGLAVFGPFAWSWFGPSAALAVAIGTLAVGAARDFARVRGWADGAPDEWAKRAADWCLARVPVYHLPADLHAQVAKVRSELVEAVAARWGKYYLFGFALPAAAMLVGAWHLKAPPAGADAAILTQAFGPLAWVTAGTGVALLLVVLAAHNAAHIVRGWAERTDERIREGQLGAGKPVAAATDDGDTDEGHAPDDESDGARDREPDDRDGGPAGGVAPVPVTDADPFLNY